MRTLTRKTHIYATAALIVAALTMTACSMQKNTARSRWWHSFHTRYNIYFNGSQAYIDASLEREQNHVDNFTEIIPLYTVSNKTSRELGQENFDRAIEKSKKAIQRHSMKKRPEWNKRRRKTERDIEWLNRKEYNPFMWKVWMLMGRSQFMKGSFDEAASTFSYMSRLYSTQPAIYGKARAWLAKCYVEQDWIYDAEDVITKINRDSIHWRAQKEWDYTYADYYIHTGQYEKAIPYLRKVIRHEMRRKQRAREWYLMGQLYAELGRKEEAYKAYRRVIRLYPPYQLEFNARIAMTEVMAGGKPKQMIRKLRRMAASDKNKDYLDQVYYAIGNIYIAERDTATAISAYEKGSAKATRSGIEKGVLLLTLGDLYWEKEEFSDARRCYSEAIGLLDKERKDYAELSARSVILDELVPYTEAVELQDSLQELAAMSEEDRNAAIDRVIEALKKKEKEEKRAQQEAEAESQLSQLQAQGNVNAKGTSSTSQQSGGSTFYFYNQTAVNQGKETFQRLWGKRENADDWQRSNKTVVATESEEEEEELTDEQRDSIMAAEAMQDSINSAADSAVNDPHKREYYLAQIPFTDEQKAKSDDIIKDGLYNSGVIFKDKLDNLPLSEKQLMRLITQYPDFKRMDEALYHLFLLYSRKGMPGTAASYLQMMKDSFPESQYTKLLSDPYYAENARFGKHMEDSLYAATYDAFKDGRYSTVKSNTSISGERFPLGANRSKFIFINGLTKLNEGDSDGCLEAMEKVVADFPDSEVSPLAGMIINGVKEGRSLQGGTFDIGNVWARRTAVLNDSDSIAAMKFVAERDAKFVCLIAFQPDSIDENKLLFEIARFNFSNFIIRNFGMAFDSDSGLRRMVISGFKSYDEALQYTREMYAAGAVATLLQKARLIIISEENMQLLGRQFSYDDYDLFYEQHYMPLKVSTVRLLTEPETIEYEEEEESPGRGYGEDEGFEDGFYNEDELYNGGVVSDEMLLELGVEEEPAAGGFLSVPEDSGSITIPEEDATPSIEDATLSIPEEELEEPVPDDGTLVIPDEEESAPAAESETLTIPEEGTYTVPESGTIIIPDEETQTEEVTQPAQTAASEAPAQAPQPAQSQRQMRQIQPQVEDTGIDFNDDFITPTPAPPDTRQQQQQDFDLEDEYYDLDGF